jgi:hypothetical protein
LRRKKDHFSRSNPAGIPLVFHNSVPTAKKTQCFSITKIKWLMLIKEIILVYTGNHTKGLNTTCRVIDFKAGGSYGYHKTLKGQQALLKNVNAPKTIHRPIN